jgi:predicted nuclease of predicted toxin-antitoxin system
MNFAPSLRGVLEQSGYPTIHVRDLGLQSASDEALVLHARQRGEVIVTNDLDFTRILAVEGLMPPLARRPAAGRRAVPSKRVLAPHLC